MRSHVETHVVHERLELIFDWYRGMVSAETGRLLYTYEPESEREVSGGSAIRDLASVWDLEVLSRFLGRDDLRPLIDRSLEHFCGFLVERDGTRVLDDERLGEPSGISHSAFLLLALAESNRPDREAEVVALADGLLRQQRPDGSYRIYFGELEDEGIEFYPGEAMLALMTAHALTGGAKYLASVERGFLHYRRRLPAGSVEDELRVFYANWQSQYGALLHATTKDAAVRDGVRDYLFALHDRILRDGFYEGVSRAPMRQATVEVACGLEGLADAYSVARREGDGRRLGAYAAAIQLALTWLLRAQRLGDCTPRERGGFGHSLTHRTQRIDVTGHVLNGFIKAIRNGLAS